jgi:hypothetical protein
MRPTVPIVEIELDKVRHLRMDFNALAQAEEVTGKSFLNGIAWQGMTVKDYRALIWACLLHEDPELTLEAVGSMVHVGNVEYVTGCLAKLWEKSTPKEEGRPLAEEGAKN